MVLQTDETMGEVHSAHDGPVGRSLVAVAVAVARACLLLAMYLMK